MKQVDFRNYLVYQLPRAVITNYHKLGSSRQHELVLLQVWRLDVWNQGIGRITFFWRLCGGIYFMALFKLMVAVTKPLCSFACRHITPVSALSFACTSLCLCVSSPFLSFIRTLSHLFSRSLRRGSTSNPRWSHFESFNYICRDLFLNKVTFTDTTS